MHLRPLYALSLVLSLMGIAQAAPQKVALKSIKTLTFSADKETTARRGSPIPQLTCKGPACSRYRQYVSVVQCSNMGDDGAGNIQWKCQVDLPSALRLGKVEVSCEGWSRAGDSNVLQGSCGLEYNLIRVPTESDPSGHGGSSWDADSIVSTLFSLLFCSVAAFIAYSFLRSCLFPTPNPRSPPRGPPGSGPGFHGPGGGGGGPDSSPPPPYDAPPGGGSQPPSKPDSSSGGGPGLLTGLGLGAAATYMATRNSNRQQQQQQQQRPYRYGGFGFEDRDDDVMGTGRRWGGGDGVAGPSRGRGGGNNGGGGGGNLGEIRTSTGFGGSSTR